MKRWSIRGYDKNKVAELKARCDLSELTLKVLNSRGYKELDDIAALFNDNKITSPFDIKDMKEAVDAINYAIDEYQLICVYGDYDCDGITATAILFDYLKNIGANVMYYIPERADGYGMSIKAVEDLAERGVSLIVTVDNGISAIAESERIYELGMKLVVTDHHQPLDKLPRAEAIVDPHRKDCASTYKDLAGAGVALKLCIALNDGNVEMIMEQYSDLCALGTVADIVPLIGENRVIVRSGLKFMQNTENYGLDKLMDASQVKREQLSASSISFQLAPRINASGRFGSPLTAVKALLADDPDDAENYVETLVTLNEKRRSTEQEIYTAILKYIDKKPDMLAKRVLILAGNNWHHGVIGIVAAKLLELYGKPVILLSIDENKIARGSARSVPGFDIFKCLSYANGEDNILDHFGGHECAGGLTVKADKINELMKRVYNFASRFELMPTVVTECDLVLEPGDITISNVKDLQLLEPFGASNAKPVFAVVGARLDRIIPLSQGKHTRLELTYGDRKLNAVMFGTAPDQLPVIEGARIDLAVNAEINVYNGSESISLRCIDCRMSGLNQERYFNAMDCYDKHISGDELPASYLKRISPSREDLVKVYKALSQIKETSFDLLYSLTISPEMNICKLRLIIDAFSETGLASYLPSSGRVKLLPVSQKVDLESAKVLTELRNKL